MTTDISPPLLQAPRLRGLCRVRLAVCGGSGSGARPAGGGHAASPNALRYRPIAAWRLTLVTPRRAAACSRL